MESLGILITLIIVGIAAVEIARNNSKRKRLSDSVKNIKNESDEGKNW